MSGGRLSYAEFGQTAAAARAAMTALSKAALDLGIDKTVSELVKLRTSQINGCAFCMAFHLKLLRSYGVEQRKLDLLSVWRESPDFTPAERAALAWAEDMARMADAAPREDIHAALQAQLITRIAPGRVYRPPAMRSVPEERILLTLAERFLVCRQLLVQIEEPGMIDIELLASGECPPRTFVFDLVLERRIGDAFLDVAVPRLFIDFSETLWVLFQLLERQPRGLWRFGHDEVGGVLGRLELAVAGP